MANDLNRHECIGRLGNDPEIKYLPGGEAVCNISVACSTTWKDKNTGEKRERTTWISYVAFGKLAEIMGEYLRKGSKVYLCGALRTRKWKDQSGNNRYTKEIVASDMQMLDSQGGGGGGRAAAQAAAYGQTGDQSNNGQTTANPPTNAQPQQPGVQFEDDIPFTPYVRHSPYII